LRLSIIAVMLLAATAFGLIAYNTLHVVPVAQVAAKGPPGATTVGYFVAARPLPRGTLAREEDFTVRSVPPDQVPAGAILESPDAKAGLPGSLVRKFVDAGSPVTLEDILRPKDRGFLASVLAPDSRAITIKVDEESGVAGLIRPGDRVDVVLTQMFDKADPARRALSETVLGNVRVIAIDQEIAQGGRPVGATVSKQAQTVSLELTPEQVKKITVAKQLGKLSLAVRAAVDQWNKAADSGAVSSCDVSPELARQNALAGQHTAVVVHSGGEVKEYSVRKQGDDGDVDPICDGSSEAARASATTMAGKVLEKR
jgi:pilus assembly protein CpaB